MNHLPSLFIVGSLKAGTTALATYLSKNPQFYFPPGTFQQWGKMEPNYFASINPCISKEDYLQYFSGMRADQIGVDSSPWYLFFAEKSSWEIREFNPSAKIIIMLRRPIEVIKSLYAELSFHGMDTNRSFDEALAYGIHNGAASRRHNGPILYQDIVNWAPQVNHYMNQFSEDHLKIILFDDFAVTTENVFEDTLRFAGAESYDVCNFNAINTRKYVLFPSVNRILRNPPTFIKRLARVTKAKPVCEAFRQRIICLITSTKKRPDRTVISENNMRRLKEIIYKQNKDLEVVLKRPLPARWYD